jgi:hypothetical protein
MFVSEIKKQNPTFTSDFVDYGGFRGPIRIWEINYPNNITYNEAFIQTYYPPELLSVR